MVAVRDADYAAMTWYPHNPLLDRWLQVYEAVARTNRAEPDAGRRLRSWALAAGCERRRRRAPRRGATRVPSSARGGAGCGPSGYGRARWRSRRWQAGTPTTAELAAISDGWLGWAAREDAWFAVLNGEVLARPT